MLWICVPFFSVSHTDDIALLICGGLVAGEVAHPVQKTSSNSWKGGHMCFWGSCTAVASLVWFSDTNYIVDFVLFIKPNPSTVSGVSV